ncbi:TPR-like protein [Peniophora sp. CONT]|nr:TPR-like protein [Peniophora sp. CONT]
MDAHSRYEETWDVAHLDTAVDHFQRAVDIERKADAVLLGWLGSCLSDRYETSGSLDDLERALAVDQCALKLVPEGHPDRVQCLNNMASSLQKRFERLGELEDLGHAIVMRQRAVELTPDEHPSKPACLHGLGNSLQSRFERLGELDDLEQAIAANQRAVKLTLDGHPSKPTLLNNLGSSLQRRFERLDELDDLELAIAAQRRTVELTPDGHPRKPIYLNNLGDTSHCRFERFGELDDLEHAIAAHRGAVELTPDGHPSKAARLSNLGGSLLRRFERLGGLDDLEQAIAAQRHANELTPDEHPSKSTLLNNFGTSLQSRFEHLGELDDLQQAIAAQWRAVALTPDGHFDKPVFLDSLGGSLHIRFERRGALGDLEQAIAAQQCAVELTLDGDPSKPLRLSNLGLSLQSRFECLGELEDIEQAIAAQQRALTFAPNGHPNRSIWLNALGISFQSRFEHRGDIDDLEHAIAAKRSAVELVPEGHPGKLINLSNLGLALCMRFERLGELSDLEEALSCFMIASGYLVGSSSTRLKAAREAVWLLTKYPELSTPGKLMSAYALIIEILPEIIWLGYSLKRRFEESSTAGSLVTSAVHAAVGVNALSQAAEWLEAGRSFIWSQILSLRNPLDELEEQHPALADRLRIVHDQLQSSAHTSSYSVTLQNTLPGVSQTSHDAADRHRGLAIEYGQILQDIRSEAGFEDYLRPKKLAALLPVSTPFDGPVVFINMDDKGCSALVVPPNGSITTLALPELTLEKAEALRSHWQSYLHQHSVRERAIVQQHRPHSKKQPGVAHVLSCIWRWIVQPVLQALDLNGCRPKSDRLPHITWCPTGPLTQLPLHAAGMYDQDSGPRIYDFVVSSYTPSLSALTRAVDANAKQRPHPSVLVVTQPDTPRLSPLPGTVVEGERLQEVFSESRITCSALNGEQATTDAVRAFLDHHAWLHLACHGSQDLTDPLQSAFALHDGRLSLADLMTTTADNAELAFLSACQTAVGDENIPEESMHLAAGMLAVGYKGVVATMWSIRDDDAPLVVEAYYKKLLELRASGTLGMGETGAAYALHEATKCLREKVGEKEFVRWAPFVHFGI